MIQITHGLIPCRVGITLLHTAYRVSLHREIFWKENPCRVFPGDLGNKSWGIPCGLHGRKIPLRKVLYHKEIFLFLPCAGYTMHMVFLTSGIGFSMQGLTLHMVHPFAGMPCFTFFYFYNFLRWNICLNKVI